MMLDTLTRFSRRAFLAAGLLMAPVLMQMQAAHAATPAEAWVSENIQRGLAILNKRQAPAARRDEFRTFLLGLIDINRVALYTLGAGRRSATPQQQSEFQEAFKDYAEAVYESRLLQYSGQTLKITGSAPGKPNETIVRTVLVDPHDSRSNEDPLEVDFRITDAGGHFQVLDASVAGIWLAILEHDDFDSFLGQNNDSVPLLIQHLRKLTRDLQK
ncbi:MAG TPA: ABC transporter substrate-binding protein [Rhizomicrobium sp.]|jgi:phospholipid transport system substrate-binding protein